MANEPDKIKSQPDNNTDSKPTVEVKVENRGRKPLPRDAAGNIVREKTDSKPNKPLGVAVAAKSRASNEPTGDQIISAQFLGKGSVSLLELVESVVSNNCATKIQKAYPEKLNEFQKVVADTSLQPKEKELIGQCVEKIAIRYAWATAHAPEIVLSIVLAEYGARQIALLRFTNSVIATRNERTPAQKEANVSAPKPDAPNPVV
jgi:hypothetical protein